jgi:hypothetical protein
VGEQLRALGESTRSLITEPNEAPGTAEQDLRNRLDSAIQAAQLPNESAFYLAATTIPTVEVEGLFSDGSRATTTLNYPPALRRAGFDLTYGETPRIVDGQLRRAMRPGRSVLEVFRDGTLIFVVEPHSSPWGAKYEVQMSANGKQYGWTFSISP